MPIRRAGTADPHAVRQALSATNGCPAVTGAITYPGGSRVPGTTVSVMRIVAGKAELVATIVPKSWNDRAHRADTR
jgi:branched-chain amino acid transport system substrate-binding protein